MTTDVASAAALITTPAVAAAAVNGSPVWLVCAAALAGAVVWTVAQKPNDFKDAGTMLLIGSFIGVVGAKIAKRWAGSLDTFKWVNDLDDEYIAGALGLVGNLIFSIIKARGAKEAQP